MSMPETQRGLPPQNEKTTGDMAETVKKTEAPQPPDRMIEQMDSDMRAEIAEAQVETVKRLNAIDASLGATVPRELAPARQEVQAQLDKNADAMQAVANETRQTVEKIIAAEASARKLRDPNSEVDAALLKSMAEVLPDDAVNGLMERGKDFSYDDKMSVLLPALASDPKLGSKLDSLGFSAGEKLGIVLRLVKESPRSFIVAAESSGLDLSQSEKMAIAQDMLEQDPEMFPEAVTGFNLSHDEVVRIIDEYHADDAAVLVASLNIPGPEGAAQYIDFSQAEMEWFMEKEKDPEARETFEKVERVKGASRELMFAIESAFPDRVAAERERFKAEQELLQPIEKVGELQKKKEELTANKPLYVNIEGRTLPACYKPKSREEVTRTGIAQGEMVGREVLAAFVDRALQMDLVPATVMRDGPEGIGTVQDWKVGKIAYRLGDEAYSAKHDEQLTRLAFFDWATQNSDRHNGNWLVSPDGKHQAIDNGSTFGKRVTMFDGMRSFPSAAKVGTPLPPELRNNVERLLASPEVMGALKKGFEATMTAEDADRSWKEFVGRLEQVKDDPNFAIQQSEWETFPQ